MLTVLESLRLSTEYLNNKGIESPRLNAELLLADILGLKRLELYLQFERPLTEDEKTKYREYLKRRASHEPLQYVLGYSEFMGKRFKVTPDVLIPRPETELLVEKISNENALFSGNILDIGTGSGNIAIMLAGYFPEAKIVSVDISEKALEIAKLNSKEILGNENRVEFVLADLFEVNFLKDYESFDIIVSNPPYISQKEMKNLQTEVKDFEPRIALTDNADGLSFYEEIAKKSDYLLQNEGTLYLEIPEGVAEKVKTILEEKEFAEIEITKDYSDIERIIKAKKNKD